MDKSEARTKILRLNAEHESDHDGGYALVDALKRASGSEPAARAVFSQVLGDLVREQDEHLWAVALEVLVQLGESGEVAALVEESSMAHDDKWRDYLVLALLRLGRWQSREFILRQVRASLQHPGTLTVPIMAALSRVDRYACLEMASTYFTAAYTEGRQRDVEGYIAAFVRNFMAVDDHLLSELVRRVVGLNGEAGRWVAQSFSDYLSNPWMTREFGERATRLGSDILQQGKGPTN